MARLYRYRPRHAVLPSAPGYPGSPTNYAAPCGVLPDHHVGFVSNRAPPVRPVRRPAAGFLSCAGVAYFRLLRQQPPAPYPSTPPATVSPTSYGAEAALPAADLPSTARVLRLTPRSNRQRTTDNGLEALVSHDALRPHQPPRHIPAARASPYSSRLALARRGGQRRLRADGTMGSGLCGSDRRRQLRQQYDLAPAPAAAPVHASSHGSGSGLQAARQRLPTARPARLRQRLNLVRSGFRVQHVANDAGAGGYGAGLNSRQEQWHGYTPDGIARSPTSNNPSQANIPRTRADIIRPAQFPPRAAARVVQGACRFSASQASYNAESWTHGDRSERQRSASIPSGQHGERDSPPAEDHHPSRELFGVVDRADRVLPAPRSPTGTRRAMPGQHPSNGYTPFYRQGLLQRLEQVRRTENGCKPRGPSHFRHTRIGTVPCFFSCGRWIAPVSVS